MSRFGNYKLALEAKKEEEEKRKILEKAIEDRRKILAKNKLVKK